MRIGASFFIDGPLDGIGRRLQRLEELGYDTVWVPQIFGWDTLTALAVAGQSTERIEIGTAVVPTYPRHPLMLAAQALTVNATLGGRLALGIGLSHKLVIENMMGMSFDKPAVHMKDYLSVLLPLLHDRSVQYTGSTMRTQAGLQVPADAPTPPVYIAAMADHMLRLAGSMADGTILWMTGPATVEQHIVPLTAKAAADAGRPSPRIVVGLPIRLTNDPDGAREQANRDFVIYGQLPSYRAMLDREGAANPGDIAILGDEATLSAALRRVQDAGATDFNAAAFGSPEEIERTYEFLASRPVG
jgi:5,10-methylenetetrahydromethanopterin reductase